MEVLYRRLAGLVILFFMMVSVAFAEDDNSAGQVIVVSGAFQALSPGNESRTLDRGAHFFKGDTLVTGTNATAQVRFTDGSVLALNPDSQIKIDEYQYDKNPKKDKTTMSLLKGGFRALTGLMSKENPESYKIETPVAVIGVRGTNFSGVLQPVKNNDKPAKNNKDENAKDDKGNVEKVELFAGVWDGNITVTNDANESHPMVLGKGNDYNFVAVSSKKKEPIGLLNPPRQLVHQCGIRNENNTNI